VYLYDIIKGFVWFVGYILVQAICFFVATKIGSWIPLYSYMVLSVVSLFIGIFNIDRIYKSLFCYFILVLALPVFSVFITKYSLYNNSKTIEIILIVVRTFTVIFLSAFIGSVLGKYLNKQ